MSKAFAVVLGIGFVVLGLATLLFAWQRPKLYSLVVGPLFLVAGIACFFHRGSPHRPPPD